MNDKNKYWIVHGGSDSYFAAHNASDAWCVVQEMNKISMQYEMPPTSKVEVSTGTVEDLNHHACELESRNLQGDEDYFQP